MRRTTVRRHAVIAYAYTVLAWTFVLCLAAQVLVAGLAVFDGAGYWHAHTTFVHYFELLPIVLLILAILARLPKWVSWLTGVEMAQIALQYALVNLGAIPAAFHPLNGMVLFVLAVVLALASGRYAGKSLSERRPSA